MLQYYLKFLQAHKIAIQPVEPLRKLRIKQLGRKRKLFPAQIRLVLQITPQQTTRTIQNITTIYTIAIRITIITIQTRHCYYLINQLVLRTQKTNCYRTQKTNCYRTRKTNCYRTRKTNCYKRRPADCKRQPQRKQLQR